ncbi:sensor histidine kinase [Ramlibacter sp. H39-3-26]|uniref:sensor histidine kinase n=1 Tax=Curvibacter soli TaxID=3031331 RepID=UPI0023DAD4CC|nr:sensor histidine kinase [Ramlibacter sp. H39-3-26]MDF1485397.1 sensor histidine kinase [Ramlibacter sp. H39-3-26]
MKNPEILSVLPESPDAVLPAHDMPRQALVFDACHAGVVLRAVLFVELVLGAGALFDAGTPLDWLVQVAFLTGGALPATLAWLIAACSLKKILARLPERAQWVCGMALGALAGLYACAMLALVEPERAAPWFASAAAGALLSAALVGALMMRARGRTPAATTARLAELQSRIRPHFLFNTLNSAIALVRAEPARAEALLEDLSELFRHALVEQDGAATLGEEIALAQRYLDIEQVRFGPRLRVNWSLDPAAVGARLPPLLLQPLVENAVKHGVEPSATGSELRIATRVRNGQAIVDITNTLPVATAQRRGHGIALRNVRDRLHLLHDVQCEFAAGTRDGLYHVRIALPLA